MRSVSGLIFKQPKRELVAAGEWDWEGRGGGVQRLKEKESRCWRREKGEGEASQNELGVRLRCMPSAL